MTPAMWTALPPLLAGVLLCFFGQRVARLAMGLLGAVVGYLLGAAAFQAVFGAMPGLSPLGNWIAGIVAAVLVGWLAYSFYVVGVLVLMGSLGWQLGWWFGGLSGFDALWTTLMAGAVALLAVAGGLVLNLPRLLLVLTTAVAGAALIVGSLPLMLSAFANTGWMSWLTANGGWVNLAFVILGAVVQLGVGGKDNLRASYSS